MHASYTLNHFKTDDRRRAKIARAKANRKKTKGEK
jgi:hypothetical protein